MRSLREESEIHRPLDLPNPIGRFFSSLQCIYLSVSFLLLFFLYFFFIFYFFGLETDAQMDHEIVHDAAMDSQLPLTRPNNLNMLT